MKLLSDFSFRYQKFLGVVSFCWFSSSSSILCPGFFSQPKISSIMRARGRSVSPSMVQPPLELSRRGEGHDALPDFSRCAGFSYYCNQHQ